MMGRAFLGRVQFSPLYRLGAPQVMTDADEDLIEAAPTVVLKFFANGCPPCGEYKPIFDEVASQTPSDITMMEVDVDDSPGLYSKYDIKATPTTIFLEAGKEVNRVEGKMTTDGLKAMIKSAFGEGSTMGSTMSQMTTKEAAQNQRPNGPRLIKTEAQARSFPAPAAPQAPAGSAASDGPSKTLLVVGGVSLAALVTGGLLLAKG